MSENLSRWICCQLGAREHYAIPRTLNQAGQRAVLITDAWVTPQSALNLLPKSLWKNLRERFHPDLADSQVEAFTPSLMGFELLQRLQNINNWEHIVARNQWFQQNAVRVLPQIQPQFSAQPILFAYSYAALELLRYAKAQGWKTVLGQIDPGVVHEQIVLAEHHRHSHLEQTWHPAPTSYWLDWQQECNLADSIMVNSDWSKQALQQAGVSAEKINVVPLAYQPPEAAQSFVRVYPHDFSNEHPLRVLFLGKVTLGKGIAALLEAAKLLEDRPIEFWVVGPLSITASLSDAKLKNVRYFGSVPRSAAVKFYQKADIFLFPTLSDGFGLTQLEAQAWKLPIIVSKFCGEVVKDKINGLVLPEVSGEAIADALNFLLKNPQQLALLSQQSISGDAFSLLELQTSLQGLAESN